MAARDRRAQRGRLRHDTAPVLGPGQGAPSPAIARKDPCRSDGAPGIGGCDNVARFLRGVGVDASEFSAPGAGGRVDVYQGLGATGAAAGLSNGVAGDCTTDACPLWSSKAALETYDEVFLGCECDEHNETKAPSSLVAMHDWLGEGGRVFATHSQATWFKNGPADFQSIADWSSGPASGASGPFTVDTTFQGGKDLEAWLAGIGAGPGGVVSLDPADVSTSVTTVRAGTSDAWINGGAAASDSGGAPSGNVKLFSTPIPIGGLDAGTPGAAPEYCGKIHVTDIHPGGGQALQGNGAGGASPAASVPAGCDGGPLSAGEEALEFLLFDLPICVETPLTPPPPPLPDSG